MENPTSLNIIELNRKVKIKDILEGLGIDNIHEIKVIVNGKEITDLEHEIDVNDSFIIKARVVEK